MLFCGKMRTPYFSVQFLKNNVRISNIIFYKNILRHLTQLAAVNDEQYYTSQQKVENEGQPQGMIAQ